MTASAMGGSFFLASMSNTACWVQVLRDSPVAPHHLIIVKLFWSTRLAVWGLAGCY